MATDSPRFGEIARQWLESKRRYVKDTTYCLYSMYLQRHLLPVFGAEEAVTEEMAQEMVSRMLAEGRSRKTVHALLAVLKAAARFGNRNYGLPPADWDVTLPPERMARTLPVLPMTDHRRLLAHLESAPSTKTIGIHLSLCTGLRLGEVCSLRWDDIDFRNRKLTVRRTFSRIYDPTLRSTRTVLSSPKTRTSNREVPMPGSLVAALRTVRRRNASAVYVVGSGERPQEPRAYREIYVGLLGRLGIPAVKFHALRHTFATRCVESGCDPKTLSTILGHSDVSTTLNLYVHPGIDQKRRCIDRMLRKVSPK